MEKYISPKFQAQLDGLAVMLAKPALAQAVEYAPELSGGDVMPLPLRIAPETAA